MPGLTGLAKIVGPFTLLIILSKYSFFLAGHVITRVDNYHLTD